VCSTFTGQENLGYAALLILLECYTINICVADISLKVNSLQLKGYTSTGSFMGFNNNGRGKCGNK
jgi:hypothetical protein